MQFPVEAVAAWATIAGTAISLFALFQSKAWLVLTSFLFVVIAIAGILYGRSRRLALESASTMIEGRSIDALNLANLRRRVNRTFVIQEACHTARFEGADIAIEWQYAGYCRTDNETGMEFSIDSEGGTSFDELHCSAFDLGRDPEMRHEIRPLLIGTDGLSKKISVPFLEPLGANQPFKLLLKCALPRCVTPGMGYYTATLSFAQKRVPRCEVHLIFAGTPPEWVRVYDAAAGEKAKLLKSLRPARQEPGLTEYTDIAKNRRGQSALVYMFWRDSI
jgi:hypothetical protein